MSKLQPKKDFSGQRKELLVPDNESGTLKRIPATDQALRRTVRPTADLAQNKQPRKRY